MSAMKRYRTLHERGCDEETIKKSRFIGYASPVASENEAIAFIEEIRERHSDARHNVYAYITGEGSNVQRYSDDKEPSGTAGIPILELLKKEGLKDVVVVVSRYFGGIKLGVGGLVRAYLNGAKIALDSAKIVEKVPYARIRVRVDYTLNGKVENELMTDGYITENIDYDDAVNMDILCELEGVDALIAKLKDLTSGTVEYSLLDPEYLSLYDGEIIS